MSSFRLVLAFLLLFLASQVRAAGFDTEDFSLEVPADFQGPITQPMGNNGNVIAFIKPHPATKTNTLLQITVYNPGTGTQPPEKTRLGSLAERYLGQFMEGVKGRRTNFSSTAPTSVTLGGLPAS